MSLAGGGTWPFLDGGGDPVFSLLKAVERGGSLPVAPSNTPDPRVLRSDP